MILILSLFFSLVSYSQTDGKNLADIQKMIDQTLASKWYEKIGLRGYAQFRYNRLGETNKKLNCQACDRSIGDKQGFFMRRARLVFSGQVSDKVFIYIQPDYATDATNQNYFQVRDAYFDYGLSDNNEWRVRSGVSKVPFGFENLQSSSIRAPLDRDDAINMAAPNERDTGIFMMWAPSEIRKRFKELASPALKGTGDYGVLAFGAYNGQSLGKRERNNDLHRVVRLTYPYKFENGQIVEASVQAYEGKVYIEGAEKNFYDGRQAVSFNLYPQPFGFQAEYNVGRGPRFEKTKVSTQNVRGGYAQINYSVQKGTDRYFPYVRFQEYSGGRKHEINATADEVTEWEFGTEWQPNPSFELTAAYALSNRLSQSTVSNKLHEKGNMIRLQAQFNY